TQGVLLNRIERKACEEEEHGLLEQMCDNPATKASQMKGMEINLPQMEIIEPLPWKQPRNIIQLRAKNRPDPEKKVQVPVDKLERGLLTLRIKKGGVADEISRVETQMGMGHQSSLNTERSWNCSRVGKAYVFPHVGCGKSTIPDPEGRPDERWRMVITSCHRFGTT
ncbi:hypothetical protein BDK51DRAFT_33472, partial [Blyttiomyces helicus]